MRSGTCARCGHTRIRTHGTCIWVNLGKRAVRVSSIEGLRGIVWSVLLGFCVAQFSVPCVSRSLALWSRNLPQSTFSMDTSPGEGRAHALPSHRHDTPNRRAAVTADAGTTATVTVGADAWRERQSQNNSRFREDQQRLGARASLPAANIKLCA